jgi:hypothetical protein
MIRDVCGLRASNEAHALLEEALSGIAIHCVLAVDARIN